jgi:hypothetical protein
MASKAQLEREHLEEMKRMAKECGIKFVTPKAPPMAPRPNWLPKPTMVIVDYITKLLPERRV